MTRGRSGRRLIWLGAVALVAATAAGAAPLLLPTLFTPETLADWLVGDRLWAVKGPGFVTSELCGRWHPWAVRLLAVAGALVVTGGWLSARERRGTSGHGAEPPRAPDRGSGE